MKSILEFRKYKEIKRPISVVTCYDFWSARIIEESNIDAVLVGDSASMVVHGFESTVNANIQMMENHVAAVRRGLKNKVIIGDMPFLAHRKGLKELMQNVERLIKAGAQAVKIEGANGQLKSIEHVAESGVPVMGHIGLTPQSIHKLGGYKVQGKNSENADELIENAKSLESAGCFAVVLELVPATLAKRITEELSIPTIGIGAGKYTSGQVLVLQDMLGMNKDFNPKFLRTFMDGYTLVQSALNNYSESVKSGNFPNNEESY